MPCFCLTTIYCETHILDWMSGPEKRDKCGKFWCPIIIVMDDNRCLIIGRWKWNNQRIQGCSKVAYVNLNQFSSASKMQTKTGWEWQKPLWKSPEFSDYSNFVVQRSDVWMTSGCWVGHGPWAMPHLAYFWLDNFKSYFGKCDTFVQSMSN